MFASGRANPRIIPIHEMYSVDIRFRPERDVISVGWFHLVCEGAMARRRYIKVPDRRKGSERSIEATSSLECDSTGFSFHGPRSTKRGHPVSFIVASSATFRTCTLGLIETSKRCQTVGKTSKEVESIRVSMTRSVFAEDIDTTRRDGSIHFAISTSKLDSNSAAFGLPRAQPYAKTCREEGQ